MFAEYLLFLAKIVTLTLAILFVVAGIIAVASKGKNKPKERLEIKKINEKYEKMEKTLQQQLFSKHELKQLLKKHKKSAKINKKNALKLKTSPSRLFVLNFLGDIRASAVNNLREEITAILTVATPQDEVVLRLESAGGMVHAYGLAASQLQRLRRAHISLTIIIDKIAASGGYMMAAVGSQILAAPFAVVGSIGVIAQLPNFHQLLKKKNIDFEQFMAGNYKRTVTMFGENTKAGREKFQAEVNETHTLFKAFVIENRPVLEIEKVATGEHWYGTDALELKLIDDITTSDDYLMIASRTMDVFEVCNMAKKNFINKLSSNAAKGVEDIIHRVLRYQQDTRFT